ncbi:hypothetical protein [uncultured Lutibacter sp.]|uniref:hypothetical protein n=1 Tax=uncultured Lutibacter sp. TaxID=437739 RepID=UPI002637F7F5|nr:hypothetical protein [uncultured Lutibacter sp.]
MPKDLKAMLQNNIENTSKLSENHRAKFEAKLQKELHATQKKNFYVFKIAASFLVLIGLSASLFYFSNEKDSLVTSVAKNESLGSISPELKTIENYYLASIQSEIVTLEETPENKELLDGYFKKISELTEDYKDLTKELNTEGLNEKTINALIENLQLRLKLLYQLKAQLNELKKLNITNNENVQI